MPAAIATLQVTNPHTRERIQQIILSESSDLSGKHLISIIDSRMDDIGELRIERPDGGKASLQLHADIGDLTPAIIRIKLRELIGSL
jgi:hypothetical protein